MVTLDGPHASVRALMETGDVEQWPELSPDGRWLAYGTNGSGRFEVYVRSYPGLGPAQPVSIEGGGSPAWHPNGRELFFVGQPDSAGTQRMMVATFHPGPPPRIGRPQPLFGADQRELSLWCSPLR